MLQVYEYLSEIQDNEYMTNYLVQNIIALCKLPAKIESEITNIPNAQLISCFRQIIHMDFA
jgi:hypothetical protein